MALGSFSYRLAQALVVLIRPIPVLAFFVALDQNGNRAVYAVGPVYDSVTSIAHSTGGEASGWVLVGPTLGSFDQPDKGGALQEIVMQIGCFQPKARGTPAQIEIIAFAIRDEIRRKPDNLVVGGGQVVLAECGDALFADTDIEFARTLGLRVLIEAD